MSDAATAVAVAETSFAVAIAREWGGGARRDRTDDLMLAKHALYQLSYGPSFQGGQRQPEAVIDQSSARPRVTQWKCGGPRRTRTADLTLIRRVL